jgi:Ca-activated chloride channel family protein
VVASFLHLLANVLVFENVDQQDGVPWGPANAVRRLRDALAGKPGAAAVAANVDPRFVEVLAAELAGLTSERWPDPVYALSANAAA